MTRLELERRKLGLSQRELAEHTDVNKQDIGRMEYWETIMGKLEKFFGISKEELMKGV
jgi:ribosome-binding protein aMBF1 (putative translation factor)